MKSSSNGRVAPHLKQMPIVDEAGPTGFSTDAELFEAMIHGHDAVMVADSFEMIASGAPILEAQPNLQEIWANMMIDPKYRRTAAAAGAGAQMASPGVVWAAR